MFFSWNSKTILPLTIAGIAGWVWYKIQKLKRRKRQPPFAGIPFVVPNPHWLLGHLRLLGDSDAVRGLRKLTVDHVGGKEKVCSFYIMDVPCFSSLDGTFKFAVSRVA